MRHVDEGTIHAWLDDQITDPAEAAAIETHLRECAECRARLADEQAAFDEARTLLDSTALSADRPAFEALAAKAGRDMGGALAPAASMTRPRRERLVRWSWAASLALAVALGWTARELADPDEARPNPAAIAAPPAVADRPDASAAPLQPVPVPGRAAPPAGATDSAPFAPTSQSGQAANAGAERRESRGQAASARAPEAAASASTAETVAQAPPAVAAPTAAPPAAPRATSAAQPLAGSAPFAAARLERAAVADGQWREVPRTEAAARTGMPLYGIDGLEPLYTGLSADGAVVRTLYRLESGAQVQLVQQRNVPSEAPATDVQSTRRALQAGRTGGLAEPQAGAAQPLTVVHGNMRLTLQAASDAADLAALSMRLRVD
jgi:plasmid stability protein